MHAKYLVLALLPTVAYSRMSIHIKPNENGSLALVNVLGKELTVITDKERELFEVDNESLKRASKKFIGKRCSDVYVKPPTPWGDVYKKYGWDVVKTTLNPYHGSVTGVSSNPVALGVHEYVNNNDQKNMTQHMSVIKEVEETISHTWTKGEELGIGREIHYNVNFGEKSLGGSMSLTYSAPWGEALTKSRIVTVGNKSTATATIPPGGKVLATLMATERTIEIKIRYISFIQGQVFCNYDGGYMGHQFYALPLKDLQHSIRTPMSAYAIETISMTYYTDVRLEVSDDTNVPSKMGKERPS